MAASWTATAVLTFDAWASRAVPSAYARRTAQAVKESLSELIKGSQGSGFSFDLRPELNRAIDALGLAETAIEASDRAGVQASRDALAAASATFRDELRSSP